MQDNKAVATYQPEFHFPGFYIFENEEVRDRDFKGNAGTRGESGDSENSFDFTAAAMETIIVSLWMWW